MTMLTTEIHEATVAFANALRDAPAVSAYRSCKGALDASPEALELMAELQLHQQQFIKAQAFGQAPTPELIDELRRCQAAVRGNETIMAYLRATNEVKAYLPTVASEITKALGTDYGRLIAPTSC